MKSTKEEITFILEVAKLLHKNGIPAHRMEHTMKTLCEGLNITGDFFTTPSSIFAVLQINGTPQTHLLRVAHGELNLEKLDDLGKIIKDVVLKKLQINKGITQIKTLNNKIPRYNKLLTILFFGLSTGSAARIFGGGLGEIIIATIIGLFVGGAVNIAAYFPKLSKIVIVVSAVFAMSIAKLGVIFFGNYNVDTATITGLIILIPGFSFTVAITEMVNGYTIGGMARFVNSLITLLLIGLGIGIASQIGFKSMVLPHHALSALPVWTLWIALLTVPLGFVGLFQAKPQDFFWITIACWISYFSYKYGIIYVSPIMAVFIASFLLGISSNLFSIIFDRYASIMLAPGIILLVPGSIGFKSISYLINSKTLYGIEAGFTMMLTALALVAGLIFSNLIISSKRSL